MAECTVESDSVPELPLVALTKVASMLQRRGVEGWVFKDPLQLAAVSRQLRLAVRSSIQKIKRRHMEITPHRNYIEVAGIIVKNELRSSYSVTRRLLSYTQQMIQRMMPTRVNHNSNMELRSSYSQMDCVDALLAFAQPKSLYLDLSEDVTPFQSQGLILMRSLPLSVTSLHLDLDVDVEMWRVDSPLDQILKAVGSKTNLEALTINVECFNSSVAATHKKSSPSVPKDSPFNHMLSLKNLCTFHIGARRLLSPAQMADLLNRSQSKITHICCRCYGTQKRDELFKAMSDVVRGNITSICCVYLGYSQVAVADELQFLDRLPNCATIHFQYYDSVSRQKFDGFGDRLLDVCCTDDVHPGRTLECSVGCYHSVRLQQYLEGGGETQMEYARGDTVVRLSIGSNAMMYQKHCPFVYSPHDYL